MKKDLQLLVKHLVVNDDYNLVPYLGYKIREKRLVPDECQFEMIYLSSTTKSLKMIERKQTGKIKQLMYKGNYIKNIFKDSVEYQEEEKVELEKLEILMKTNRDIRLISTYIENEEYRK